MHARSQYFCPYLPICCIYLHISAYKRIAYNYHVCIWWNFCIFIHIIHIWHVHWLPYHAAFDDSENDERSDRDQQSEALFPCAPSPAHSPPQDLPPWQPPVIPSHAQLDMRKGLFLRRGRAVQFFTNFVKGFTVHNAARCGSLRDVLHEGDGCTCDLACRTLRLTTMSCRNGRWSTNHVVLD